jgi:hypothetical protein
MDSRQRVVSESLRRPTDSLVRFELAWSAFAHYAVITEVNFVWRLVEVVVSAVVSAFRKLPVHRPGHFPSKLGSQPVVAAIGRINPQLAP